MTEKNFWNEKYMTMEKDEVERVQMRGVKKSRKLEDIEATPVYSMGLRKGK